jgi:two-component system sensor histidine kinase BaeS
VRLGTKLTLAFALVALTAVALTALRVLVAAQSAQQELVNILLQRLNEGWDWRGRMVRGWDLSTILGTPGEAIALSLRSTALLSAVLAAILAIVAGALLAQYLTAPLRALVKGTRRIEAGERGLRLDLPEGKDELSDLTEAFNSMAAGLERQEAMRRDMVADIVHDLRTPLSVLRSEIEAMQDGVTKPDPANLGRLHAEVMMLAGLVEDLRTLSLAEGGGLNLRLEVTPVGPLLARTLSAFNTRALEARSALRLEPVEIGLAAVVDAARVERILHNLLDNAIRYASPSNVSVGAQREDGGVSITVRDRGPGLSEEALGRVFDRFYRADASRTRKGGSGLGLTIARALAEAHGGRLEASNRPGGGAEFKLWFPGEPTAEPAPQGVPV